MDLFLFVLSAGREEDGRRGVGSTPRPWQPVPDPQSSAIFTSASHTPLTELYVSSTELDRCVLVSSKNAFAKKFANEFTQLIRGALLIVVSWAAFLSSFPLETWSILFWGGYSVTFKRMWVMISHLETWPWRRRGWLHWRSWTGTFQRSNRRNNNISKNPVFFLTN